nr:PREDICTED: partitioning defective 6 homolog gamma-like isoform X1 [Anolis carolinensis]|eukprot:XP_016848418.1 PREDICTED: partitioning defective 6 homolog gamma-like isoform X1 [Anolis carolinensis]
MSRSVSPSPSQESLGSEPLEVKSKFGAEFRRFIIPRYKLPSFEEFITLILDAHHIINVKVKIKYADFHGRLHLIYDMDSCFKAYISANPTIRIFVQPQAGL